MSICMYLDQDDYCITILAYLQSSSDSFHNSFVILVEEDCLLTMFTLMLV